MPGCNACSPPTDRWRGRGLSPRLKAPRSGGGRAPRGRSGRACRAPPGGGAFARRGSRRRWGGCRGQGAGRARAADKAPGIGPSTSRTSREASRAATPRCLRCWTWRAMPVSQRSQRKNGKSGLSRYFGKARAASRLASWITSDGSTRPRSRRSSRSATIRRSRPQCASSSAAQAAVSPSAARRS